MKNSKLIVSLLIIVIIITLALNVQFYFFSSGFKEDMAAAAPVSEAFDEALALPAQAQSQFMSVKPQLADRTKIDDFLEPGLWTGTENESADRGCYVMTSQGDYAQIQRSFSGFLQLGSYMYLDITVEDQPDVSWLAVYLLGDATYSDYFECNLIPFLADGNDGIVINQKDFSIGSGTPDWNRISAIRIAFQTTGQKEAALTVREISTYSATPMYSLWFDDGWSSVYTQAYPLMQQRGQKGILSVISSHVGFSGYCNEEQLGDLYASGWDLCNHTHNHKNLTELDSTELRHEIEACKQYLDSKGFLRASDHFVPPFGAINDTVDNMIMQYAKTSRHAWATLNRLPLSSPYTLGFMEVTNDTTPDTAKQWIDNAIQNDLWIVLLFHHIEDPADVSTKYEPEKLQEILNYLHEKREQIRCVTVSEIESANIIRPTAAPQTEEEQWRLVWEDHFDGGSLDEKSWNVVSKGPSVNNELQTYREENIRVADGCLEITSDSEDDEYYSGAVTTDKKQLIQYGKLEIKAKLPAGQGIFPALWLKPSSGDVLPEIDIVEFLGHEPKSLWHVFHYENNAEKETVSHNERADDFTKDFHIFGLEWTEQSIKWLIDGKETFSVENPVPSNKMYLYINTAIGGDWPGSPDKTTDFPQTMLIDYVKYYTRSTAK